MRTGRTLTIVLAVSAVLGLPLDARERSARGSFGEYLEVQLVTVELFATDREGMPVLDLTADEIRVLEDGEPVEIRQFTAPLVAPAVRAEDERAYGGRGEILEGGPEHDSPIRVAIFVDNLNTGPGSRFRLLGQLREVLDRGLDPRAEVMVASFDGRLEIRQPFTRDRRQLRRTLEEVEQLTGDRLFPELRDQRALERIQFEQETNPDGPCVFVGQLARNHADEAKQQVERTLSALKQFIASLAGVPGRKVLLHVSDGIPLLPGAEAWIHAISLCDTSGTTEGVAGAYDVRAIGNEATPSRFDPVTARIEMMSYDTTDQWRRLAAQAAAQRVVFYPLYAAGLGTPARSDVTGVQGTMRGEMERVLNQQDTLTILADETGGRAYLDTNDFRAAILEVIDESMASYELAYQSPSAGDEKLHTIRIQVDRPGVHLRYRKSYQSKTVRQRVEDGVLSALFYGLEENPLEVSVNADVGEARLVDGKLRVPIEISLPLSNLTLLAENGASSGLFTVFVAAQHAFGEMTPIGRKTIPLLVDEEGLSVGGGRYQYVVEIDLRLGRTRVAVAVRDEVGGETSYVTSVVDSAG